MTEAVQTMVTTVVGSVMTCCALLHSISDLKAMQMTVHCSLICELMLYKLELDDNVTKSVCCVKGEGAVDYSTITSWFKKFFSCVVRI